MTDIANVTIQSKAWGDLRFVILARALGLPDAHVALIRCARLWAWQTANYSPERPTYVVSDIVIEAAIGVPGAAAALVRSRLAEETPEGFRICGSAGCIEWLHSNRRAGKLGGQKNKCRWTHNVQASALSDDKSPAYTPAQRNDDHKSQAPALAPDNPPVKASDKAVECTSSLIDPRSEDQKSRSLRARDPVAVYDPDDFEQRRSVALELWEAIRAARWEVAKELGLELASVISLPKPQSHVRGWRDLLQRVHEEGESAPKVCNHIREVLIAQARSKQTIDWLSEKAFTEGGWRTAREAIPNWRRVPHATQNNTSAFDALDEVFDAMKQREETP